MRMEVGTVSPINWSIDCKTKSSVWMNKSAQTKAVEEMREKVSPSWDEMRINKSILPRVPEHPAFPSSPSHLGRCVSLRSRHVWVRFSRSVWRRRLRRSSHPGLLLLLLLLLLRTRHSFGCCSEVCPPRGSWRSDACTVRRDSWPRRSPRTWRSSASLNHSARQVCRERVQPSALCSSSSSSSNSSSSSSSSSPRSAEFPPSLRLDAIPLPTPSNCRVYTTAQLHRGGPIGARDAAWRGDEPRSNSC